MKPRMSRTLMLRIMVGIVDKVMDENQREKRDTWQDKTEREHLAHARVHLDAQEPLSDEDLTHALTRVAMAAVLRFRNEFPVI